MSVSLQLYIIGGLQVFLPVIFLVMLYRKHKFRISSFISGIGCYFLAANILTGTFIMFLSSLGLGQQFWEKHEMISSIVNVLLQVIFQNITIFLAMKYVLKKKIRIYDGIAIGVSYWIFNVLNYSTNAINYARIASMSAEGRLSEMVTETLTLESLEEYAALIQENGISSFYIQLLGVLVLSVMTAVVCVFLFHALKRGNIKIFLAATGTNILLFLVMNLSLNLAGELAYCIACVLVIVVSLVVFFKYWAWYKEQQAELLRKKQEYAKYLKAANGNVVSVKPVGNEESNDKPEKDAE